MPIYIGDNQVTQVSLGDLSLCVRPGDAPTTLYFPTSAPSAPQNLTFTRVLYDYIFAWEAPTGEAVPNEYVIYYSSSTYGSPPVWVEWKTVTEPTYNLGPYDTTFPVNTQVAFRVLARNCFGDSPFSNIVAGIPGGRAQP